VSLVLRCLDLKGASAHLCHFATCNSIEGPFQADVCLSGKTKGASKHPLVSHLAVRIKARQVLLPQALMTTAMGGLPLSILLVVENYRRVGTKQNAQ
jgi:hypothetical protein